MLHCQRLDLVGVFGVQHPSIYMSWLPEKLGCSCGTQRLESLW